MARLGTPAVLRRFAVVFLFLVPMLTAVAFAAPRSLAQDPVVVTMVTDTAGLGDQNFNDLANKGGTQAATDFGVDFRVIESRDAASYVPNLTEAAEQSDLTVGVGFLLTDAITEVANQYPDDKFLLIDSVSDAPNVSSVTFKEQEGGFLAGVVAGLSTKTNKVGIVGGQRIPPVIRYEVGFVAGVKSVNPTAEVIIGYADTFGDPALGKELTLAQFNQGADIVFPIAGLTGVGSFEAAKEKGPDAGVWVIAADTDQSHLGPEYQLCAVTKGVDTAVYTTSQAVVEGTFAGGAHNLGITEGGMGLATPGDKVAPDVLAIADLYEQAIVAGTVIPPVDDAALEAFVPTAPDALGTPEAMGTPAA